MTAYDVDVIQSLAWTRGWLDAPNKTLSCFQVFSNYLARKNTD